MRIGPYQLHAIDTGTFALDGGAMFGVVPRTLWEKSLPPDAQNRIPMAARALLLTGGGRTVLIDTGNGRKLGDKLEAIYKLDNSRADLLSSLARHGVRPGDVTDVILTHLHFDHAGGGTTYDGGEAVPTFPRARYHVQREHWLAALAPTERDRASFFSENYLPLERAGQVDFTEGEGEILPGISCRVVHGHTTALQCPLISDGTSTLLFCADLLPTSAHVPLAWIMAYDLRPLVTLEEKRRILTEAADGGWTLFFEHDPVLAAARLARNDRGGIVLGERVEGAADHG